MNRLLLILFSFSSAIICCTGFRQTASTPPSALPKGTSLLNQNYYPYFTLYNAIGTEPPQMQIVPLEHPTLDKAFQLHSPQKPDNKWDYSISTANTENITKGDIVLASFHARIIDSQYSSGTISAVLMEPLPSYAVLASIETTGTQQWKQYRFAFTADSDYKKNGLQLLFLFGYAPQTVEIADITFTNLGSNINITELNMSREAKIHKRVIKEVTYDGRSPTAQWRTEANKRIEQIRKGDITLIVRDKLGNPITNAEIEIEQQSHSFWFGNEIRAHILLENKQYLDHQSITKPDIEKYKQTVSDLFNITAFGQSLVWYYWDEHGKKSAVKAYDQFLKPNNIALRGIPLVWSGKQKWKNPLDLMAMQNDQLKQTLNAHITDLLTTLKGRAVMWDVLNEPISEPDIIDKLGPAEAVNWFKLTKKLEPNAKLYCNDYGLLTDRKKLLKFVKLINYLKDNGAPIDGVSPQSHIFASDTLPSIQSIKESFDILASTGLDVYPDQFEAVIKDPQVHADFTRDFYTLAFSHPAVVGVTHWGFWQGDIWMTDAAWFHKDWSPKPFAKVYTDLVFDKWWTKTKGKTDETDETGKFKTRGFTGQYKLTATVANKSKSVDFNITSEGNTIIIKM